MLNLITNKLQELHSLCVKYDIKTAYLFGSTTSSDFNEGSDIDILISFKDISIEKYTDNYFAFHSDLEKLFRRKVDLITERSLSNPYFIKSVQETKPLLYVS
jgi:uncharacterized protein